MELVALWMKAGTICIDGVKEVILRPSPKWLFGDIERPTKQNSRCGDNHIQVRTSGRLQVRITCDVDQAECIRHGADAPSSTVKIEFDPKSLTEEQRNFVADYIYGGLRFPNNPLSGICPPTYAGFIAAVNHGVEYAKWAKAGYRDSKTGEELKQLRQSLIKAAVEQSEKCQDQETKNTEASVSTKITRR